MADEKVETTTMGNPTAPPTADEKAPGVGEAKPSTAVFKKKKRKGNMRARKTDTSTEEEDDTDVRAVLAETRVEQFYRQRSKGVSAIGLATGEKVTKEQEIESGGWSLKTGGIMPANTSVKDRERDRDGEDTSVAKGLESAFTGTQDIDWQDAEMKRYVEEQMMMGQGREEEEEGDTRTDYEKRKQELFEVPTHFRELQKKGVLKDVLKNGGMMANTMLSGIPEINLGVETKFENVKRTDEARQQRMQGSGGHKRAGSKAVFGHKMLDEGDESQLNYGRARFFTSTVKDKRQLGSSKGVVQGDETVDHTAAFEAAKKRAFDKGEVDSAKYTAHPEKVQERGSYKKREGATDGMAVHKFAKRQHRMRNF
eukprot:m.15505 g.15505  ORF g.15505 m.15505 type:complete len:368 (+) comp10762_c0_seq2:80-1183(+)